MLLSTLLRLTMVGSIVYCTVSDQPQYLWLSPLTLLVFTVRGLVAAHGDAKSVNALGEQTYYLGFLGTLSTLLGLLLRISLSGSDSIDQHFMLTLGILAAVSILAGFLAMSTLTEYAGKLADQGSPMDTSTSAESAPQSGNHVTYPAVSNQANSGDDEVVEINRKLLDVVARVLRVLENLPAALSNAVDVFASTSERAHEITEEFKTDVSEMNSALDELERLKKRILDEEDPVYAHEER